MQLKIGNMNSKQEYITLSVDKYKNSALLASARSWAQSPVPQKKYVHIKIATSLFSLSTYHTLC